MKAASRSTTFRTCAPGSIGSARSPGTSRWDEALRLRPRDDGAVAVAGAERRDLLVGPAPAREVVRQAIEAARQLGRIACGEPLEVARARSPHRIEEQLGPAAERGERAVIEV